MSPQVTSLSGPAHSTTVRPSICRRPLLDLFCWEFVGGGEFALHCVPADLREMSILIRFDSIPRDNLKVVTWLFENNNTVRRRNKTKVKWNRWWKLSTTREIGFLLVVSVFHCRCRLFTRFWLVGYQYSIWEDFAPPKILVKWRR